METDYLLNVISSLLIESNIIDVWILILVLLLRRGSAEHTRVVPRLQGDTFHRLHAECSSEKNSLRVKRSDLISNKQKS